MEPRSSDTWRDVLLARLQDAMWGYSGSNGVVGSTKEHAKRITELERFQQEISALREYARWTVLGICGVIGFLLTEPAAKLILALIGLPR